MAKRAKTQKEEDGHGVSAIRGNGFDPDAVTGFVERIENVFGDINKERSESMHRCKTMRADIDEIYKEAKGAGIPKKALKAVVKKRGLIADIDDCGSNLEDDDASAFEQLQNALGMLRDLPLGQSALASKRAPKNGSHATA